MTDIGKFDWVECIVGGSFYGNTVKVGSTYQVKELSTSTTLGCIHCNFLTTEPVHHPGFTLFGAGDKGWCAKRFRPFRGPEIEVTETRKKRQNAYQKLREKHFSNALRPFNGFINSNK